MTYHDTLLATLSETLQHISSLPFDRTVGAELEVHGLRAGGRPRHGLAVPWVTALQAQRHPVTEELGDWLLEINASPRALAGQAFEAMQAEMRAILGDARRFASQAPYSAEVCLIGIPPGLLVSDLTDQTIVPKDRYRLLSAAMNPPGSPPFLLEVGGEETFSGQFATIAIEAGNASCQGHVSFPVDTLADGLNAADFVTALTLAVSTNSPLLFGLQTWMENRIPVFEISTRAQAHFGRGWSKNALGVFAEAIDHPRFLNQPPPGVSELQLMLGTCWRWNRPVLKESYPGQVRLEMRALPSGPTLLDNLANLAYQIGLVLHYAPLMPELVQRVPYQSVRQNFYAAAQTGLHTELWWPSKSGEMRLVPARELVLSTCDLAYDALVEHGLDPGEATRLIQIIADRARSGKTGADWQLLNLEHYEGRGETPIRRPRSRRDALRSMFADYQQLSHCGRGNDPVGDWPLRP